MGDLAQAMCVVVEPRYVATESFWTTAPWANFTECCRQHRFSDDSERQRRRLAGLRAEQELAES